MKRICNLFCIALLVTNCGEQKAIKSVSMDMPPDASCALDGMLLAVHDGPKAQILRTDGSRGYFCDTKEIIVELLDPVRKRRVVGVWLQTLDEHTWDAHADGWRAADSLLLVAGSQRMGAMGPTLAPFIHRERAEHFVREYGGRILRFEEVDQALLEQLHQQGMAHLE